MNCMTELNESITTLNKSILLTGTVILKLRQKEMLKSFFQSSLFCFKSNSWPTCYLFLCSASGVSGACVCHSAAFLNPFFTLAFVTHEDISRLQVFQEQTVMVVKAPEETKLEVPPPKEVRQHWCAFTQNHLLGFLPGRSWCPLPGFVRIGRSVSLCLYRTVSRFTWRQTEVPSWWWPVAWGRDSRAAASWLWRRVA